VGAGPELRSLMRRVPAGVCVVTVDAAGQRLGLTVASLVSLSLEPPLVGASISRQAALHELLGEAGEFGVSFLAAGQERLAQHFARGVPPIAMWTGVDVRPGGAPPLLEGAIGWLVCALRGRRDAGDHSLFEGEVLAIEQGVPGAALAFVNGNYVAL
jgi:flavin reductase (DIM6/NTAB) family NADH-FMN oxidoreductase RutF